jgi:hypothetical protein
MDADMILNRNIAFAPVKGKPYYIKSQGCVASAMYCNGRQDIFHDMLYYVKETGKCPCAFVRDNITEFNPFPDGMFLHLRLGRKYSGRMAA